MIEIRSVTPEDVETFRELRLEALRTSPEAFSASYEDFVKVSMDDVRKRIRTEEDNFIVGAFAEGQKLCGMVGFGRDAGRKSNHKGTIWGVYVAAECRGQGVAERLMKEVLHRASQLQGLQQVNLIVVTTNQPALSLYNKLGFTTFGVEKKALIIGDQSYDEAYMVWNVPQ